MRQTAQPLEHLRVVRGEPIAPVPGTQRIGRDDRHAVAFETRVLRHDQQQAPSEERRAREEQYRQCDLDRDERLRHRPAT